MKISHYCIFCKTEQTVEILVDNQKVIDNAEKYVSFCRNCPPPRQRVER